MSGIVGICRRNGAPVERALLQSLVDFLAFRGPDSRTVWSDGAMGLGHAMLRTTHESLREQQPANLHERFWIAADARLDGRSEFATEITHAGHEIGRAHV